MKHSGLLILCVAVAGCTVAGTSALRSGRAAYNDALVATNNEQLLARPLNILELSGGGQNGAFGAGFLKGSLRMEPRGRTCS